MKESSLLFAAFIAVNAAGCLGPGFSESRYRVEDEETIRKTLEFSSGAGPKVLEVDNVQGSIKVTGDDGRMVEMVANRTNRAESQSILQTAKQEVKLDIKDKADTIEIYVDEPGHEHSTTSSSHSRWHDRGYRVKFDFEIRLPRQAAVHLWTVNDGDIDVQNVAGDFNVSNVNGNVSVLRASGSGRAHTVNGQVTVGFTGNPKSESSFKTANGTIDVTFQPDLSADLRFKTFNGGVYTDFPGTLALPRAADTTGKRNGNFFYRSSDFSSVRVGKGGPEMSFDTLNGDVLIRQAK